MNALVNEKQLCETKTKEEIAEGRAELAEEGIGFNLEFAFTTHGEAIFVTDPYYLVDDHLAKEPEATFQRERGAYLDDFGGDCSGEVWWREPYLVLPVSAHYKERPEAPAGVKVLADEVGCDSGSFIFFPMSDDMPASLRKKVKTVLKDRNGASLALPAGHYKFFYEQFSSEPGEEHMYRNIVARRT